MPVGAGSIKRAAKKAVELEEKMPAAKKNADKKPAEKKNADKKPAEKKNADKKPVAKKTPAKTEAVRAAAKEQETEVAASVISGTDPQVMDMVLSMRDGTPIANTSEQLGRNQRVEVLQELPVYLL